MSQAAYRTLPVNTLPVDNACRKGTAAGKERATESVNFWVGGRFSG
jgi:hypothetical protein